MLAVTWPASAKVTSVKVLQSWSGTLPPGVPALLQSSVASADDLQQVWTMCTMKGVPPKVDFGKRIVIVATGRGSGVKFADLALDNGTLKTSVVVTPDMPGRTTCALALVNRAGIKTVNGVPVGK
jgi:hypothetical protein